MNQFENLIQSAIEAINEQKFSDAELFIKAAMQENVSAPQPHNLYGILCEYKEDTLLAIKHYRASYVLDPTYKPAIRNLERVTRFNNLEKANVYDLINYQNEDESCDYFIEYDVNKVGHVKKINN